MSKIMKSSAFPITLINGASEEQQVNLQPNDGLILMHIALYAKSAPEHCSEMRDMLSEEGSLIAQVLMGETSTSKLPPVIVSTAEALRQWAAGVPSTAGNSRRSDSAPNGIAAGTLTLAS